MSAVLIVDDSPADRIMFRTILSRAGFDVHEVAYGRDALEKAREVMPHAVVLDVNLPDIDGHSVCRNFKADAAFGSVPVLMLTVRDREDDILAGLEAGADDYVAKDAAPEIILARVRRLVRDRQMSTVTAMNEGMAQVGRLLAGIVHEIRGPLSVIRGNAEILKMGLAPGHESLERVDPIIRGCQLLQLRLEHLMAAVRGGPATLFEQDVTPLIRESADLFLRGTDPRRGKVLIAVEAAEPLPWVKVDGGRLLQVLLNLFGNAHEAIVGHRGDGRITVRLTHLSDPDGNWVRVEVSDDGPGISDTHLRRIFEPFYTTKPTGSGYGLYLATEILREHGGRLTVCNNESNGACFTVWLPVTVELAAAHP